MADSTITITGIDDIIKFLNETAPEAVTQGVQDALDDLSNDIEDRTTSLCPVRTGALRDSIDVNVTDFTLTAMAGEDYASFVDGGTRFMDAQPFFEDPINTLVEQFEQDIEQMINDALEF